jgi:hypothetical protein
MFVGVWADVDCCRVAVTGQWLVVVKQDVVHPVLLRSSY